MRRAARAGRPYSNSGLARQAAEIKVKPKVKTKVKPKVRLRLSSCKSKAKIMIEVQHRRNYHVSTCAACRITRSVSGRPTERRMTVPKASRTRDTDMPRDQRGVL